MLWCNLYVRNLTEGDRTMTTIQPHSPYATLINVFTVAPERARELTELLKGATDEVIRYLPGFISANIHLSTDGSRVVNYAQWDSAEAFQAMRQNPAAREHIDKCAEVATGFDPRLYTVESVHAASRT
jgi:heme-degrading monooxygenase HmoA